MPAKITNTSLCAAIDNQGVVAYQMFDSGMHSEDFLGFMANLVSCLKLGRNTSMDNMQEKNKCVPNVEMCGQNEVVFVLDNATIHTANKIKKTIMENYNVILLPAYSPYLNIIEMWFS